MDTHIALDNNNPINCTDEQNLCEDCQHEKQKDENGFEYCNHCDICVICVENNEECICTVQ
tara:strand:+ start:190 stop:372 length:183 start_codon:yes stop_codon:yes gene_type:complete